MLKIQKLSIAALMVSAVISGQVFAEDNTFDEKAASYAVGTLMGSQMKDLVDSHKDVIKYDNTRILDGLKDALEGKVDVRKDEKIQKTLESIEAKLAAAAKAKAKAEAIAKQAKEEGDKFRAEFAKGKDVKTTQSGLMYKIENAGKGDAIKATDTVKVHYTGKLPNGKVFDSSVERGQPVEFQLDQVIKGWTEGLQLVKKGGKIQLVIAPELGYGEQGAGASIPPNSTLIFDVEVLDVNPKAEK
ncbi:TPA: FKBP-type peptidyl-prolyl cis-trans isomerase [Haemophilus influenzae]